MASNHWKTLWWFPLIIYRTGCYHENCFVSRYGTFYLWRWKWTPQLDDRFY